MNNVVGKTDLLRALSHETGLPIAKCREVLDLMLHEIGVAINQDGEVRIINFGRFHRWFDKGGIKVPHGYSPPTWRPRFKPADALLKVVNHERPVQNMHRVQLRHNKP
jgi:nucleoid DNA-binding protein